MNEEKIDQLAKKIWNYHKLQQKLEKADVILVLCSLDIRVAEHAVDLFMQGYAPFIIFSGGVAHQNDLLATGWDKPEAEVFAEVAIQMGVPKEKILIENQAQNTGENITNSFKLLNEKDIVCKKLILVQKPYMLRRTYATFMKQWPGKEVEIMLTTPEISFEDYAVTEVEKNLVINVMVGDLQRIKIYSEKGFQIPQEIPEDVWQAYEKLVKEGFDKHLIKE